MGPFGLKGGPQGLHAEVGKVDLGNHGGRQVLRYLALPLSSGQS
jgi:hypothetical protein